MKTTRPGGPASAGKERRNVTPVPALMAVEWLGESVAILDQRFLPREERYLRAETPEEVAQAIRTMAVRGAPLLGIAAAFGLALAARRSDARDAQGVVRDLRKAGRVLAASRPTAANVTWAVARVLERAERAGGDEPAGRGGRGSAETVRSAVEAEAMAIAAEDEQSCLAIGTLGSELVPDGARILTHCNTGALATGGIGTALGVISTAHEAGKRIRVWVDETRPVLQGARLTAWELQRLGIPMTLIADTVPGSLMARGLVDLVVVGADRIAANGDVANKVGTYQLAVLAKHHRIPFFVAAPISTVDLQAPDGEAIRIEERDPAEVLAAGGVVIAPAGTRAANPAFDVTPGRLITAIVTDRGVARPPFRSALARLASRRTGRTGQDRWPLAAAERPAMASRVSS